MGRTIAKLSELVRVCPSLTVDTSLKQFIGTRQIVRRVRRDLRTEDIVNRIVEQRMEPPSILSGTVTSRAIVLSIDRVVGFGKRLCIILHLPRIGHQYVYEAFASFTSSIGALSLEGKHLIVYTHPKIVKERGLVPLLQPVKGQQGKKRV